MWRPAVLGFGMGVAILAMSPTEGAEVPPEPPRRQAGAAVSAAPAASSPDPKRPAPARAARSDAESLAVLALLLLGGGEIADDVRVPTGN